MIKDTMATLMDEMLDDYQELGTEDRVWDEYYDSFVGEYDEDEIEEIRYEFYEKVEMYREDCEDDDEF